jgi:hypothetical protein
VKDAADKRLDSDKLYMEGLFTGFFLLRDRLLTADEFERTVFSMLPKKFKLFPGVLILCSPFTRGWWDGLLESRPAHDEVGTQHMGSMKGYNMRTRHTRLTDDVSGKLYTGTSFAQRVIPSNWIIPVPDRCSGDLTWGTMKIVKSQTKGYEVINAGETTTMPDVTFVIDGLPGVRGDDYTVDLELPGGQVLITGGPPHNRSFNGRAIWAMLCEPDNGKMYNCEIDQYGLVRVFRPVAPGESYTVYYGSDYVRKGYDYTPPSNHRNKSDFPRLPILQPWEGVIAQTYRDLCSDIYTQNRPPDVFSGFVGPYATEDSVMDSLQPIVDRVVAPTRNFDFSEQLSNYQNDSVPLACKK